MEKTTTKKIKVNWALPDQAGNVKNINEMAGKNGTILYVYPKDNTPGCTVEAQEFNSNLEHFKKKGFEVIGLSRDTIKSHANFATKNNIKFPLLSDPDINYIQKLGAYGEGTMYGKTVKKVARSTFILDNNGNLVREYRNVKAKGHAERVLQDLDDVTQTLKNR